MQRVAWDTGSFAYPGEGVLPIDGDVFRKVRKNGLKHRFLAPGGYPNMEYEYNHWKN